MYKFGNQNLYKMQIISDDGFYQFDTNGVCVKSFIGKFPGTIVNLQFCTDDDSNYALKSEINIDNIF